MNFLSRHSIAWVYFGFAIAGAILPTLANIEFMKLYGPGFEIDKFITLANANPAASSLSRDLLISSGAMFIWIINESRRLNMKNLWIVIVGTFIIAFAFSGPLFLFLRERRLLEIENNN